MSLKPEMANSANWELVTSVSGVSSLDGDGFHIPITPLEVPVLLNEKTLAITCNSSNAPDHWTYGGVASMKVNIGVTVGGGFTTHGASAKKLWLREITLVRFPDLCNEYSLIIYPPKYFRQITCSIFQYVGQGVSNLEGKLDVIHDLVSAP